MNIDEKNLPEAEELNENTQPEEKAPKKLPVGVLAAIIGGAVALIALVVVLVILLAGGNKCKGHVDADDDYKCDNCGEDYDDGDEAPDVTTVTVSFAVKLDNGQALSGVKFSLTRGEKSYELTTDSNGSASVALEPGAYAISYDYDSIPEYCTPDTFGVKITEGTTSVNLLIVDNQPDGSAAKPFFVSDIETEITLAPGQKLYYNYRGSTEKYIIINNESVVVNYGGETYYPEDGVINLLLLPEIGKMTSFSLENVGAAEVTTVMQLIAPLGSGENPIILTESSAKATVSDEITVHYSWTADKDGVLVLTSPIARNNISITKVMENDVSIISQTYGSSAAYLVVSEGDIITVGVSALAPGKDDVDKSAEIEVQFALEVYSGTEGEPVPVLKNDISLSLDPGAKVAFISEVGKSLSLSDESAVCVYNGDDIYTNEDGTEIDFVLTSAMVFVENKSDHVNGIVISFK